MNDLVDFLLARFAEDQEKLTLHSTDCRYLASDTYEECDCNGDAFLVASIEAKRRIIELHALTVEKVSQSPFDPDTGERRADEFDVSCAVCGWASSDPDGGCETLRLLALPYADRPGFRQEWRP